MMKKNVLAKKILCGLLAAGVVGVSGSALAAVNAAIDNQEQAEVNINGVYDAGIYGSTNNTFNFEKVNVTINPDSEKKFAGVRADAVATGRATINLGDNGETININVVDQTDKSNNQAKGLWAVGKSGNFNGGLINVEGKNLIINVESKAGWAFGIQAQNMTSNASDTLEKATININSENTYVNVKTGVPGQASGLTTMSQGVLNINSNLEVHADNAITTRGDSVININTDGKHTTKLYGDISFSYDEETSGTKVDAKLNVNLTGADSLWNGNAVVDWGLKNNTTSSYEQLKESGKLNVKTFDLTIADKAQWNPTTIEEINEGKEGTANIALNNLTLNNGIINLDSSKLEGEDAVQIENLNGSGGTINTNDVDNTLVVTNAKNKDTKLAVHGTGEIADKLNSGEIKAQDLADVVIDKDEKSIASTASTDAGTIAGAYSFDVDANGEVVQQSIEQKENPTNRAVSDMASISLMTWRAENNDMNKRLGELRDSKGEHGAWARMARGESKYGAQNVKNQYNYYQVGYDEKLSVNPNWTVGVALTRTEGNSTFATGSGENKHTGVALYGSYLNDNGSFIDLIAKYARMDNDYKTIGAGVGNADYKANGYSISAEYGKRFTKDNGFWIEPQVELTYGTVGSANYTTSKGAQVYQESVDSLVGRLGFSLGKNIKQGNVYVRASYLYDFDGETKATMSKGTQKPYSFEQDLGGGWWEVGVGTNINLSDATHLYFDVEKTYGGNVATPWQWNAGVRWSF